MSIATSDINPGDIGPSYGTVRPRQPVGTLHTMQRLLKTLLAPLFFTVTLPYQLTTLALSAGAQALVRLLLLLRAPPKWYLASGRAKELALAFERMAQREELYRKKLLELQQEVELRDKDRRRAVRHAHRLRREVSALQGQLSEIAEETSYCAAQANSCANGSGAAPAQRGQQAAASGGGSSGSNGEAGVAPGLGSVSTVTLSLAALSYFLWGFFASDPLSFHRKVVYALLFPTVYCSYGALQLGGRFNGWAIAAVVLTWFTVGFTVCDRITPPCEP